MSRITSLNDVVSWRLCLGCGVCAYMAEKSVKMTDFPSEGIRPVLTSSEGCADALKVCPVVQTSFDVAPPGDSFALRWGPVLEIWEGHATDPEIRFKGSSGGALTAISAYCLEKVGMHGVLHIAADERDPVRNHTRMSRCREELLSATGSRYSPAAVCDRLDLMEKAPFPCVFIGKPVEIAALRNVQKLRPALSSKIGLALSFFCAESPSTNGTVALLNKMGLKDQPLENLKYRGNGWPGHFAPVRKGAAHPCQQITYRESWSFLQAFRPWSTQMWPDGSGELADISCGDPWYQEPDGQNPGASLVVVRTEKGREIIRGAIEAGYLTLTPAEPWKLEKSQVNLLRKKGAVWGRRLICRLFGLPVTQFKGLDLFHCWLKLSVSDKLRSTLGTARRILSRRLYRRLELSSLNKGES